MFKRLSSKNTDPKLDITSNLEASPDRTSQVFRLGQKLPQERQGDTSSHRLYAHYYADLLS